MKRRAWALGIVAVLGAVATAAAPQLAQVVVSDSREGPAKKVFKPQTAKVYVRAKLIDVPPGSKIRGDWIAVKTKVAPPNYKVDSAENTIGPGMTQYTFSMSKPTAGWPEGDYRVEIFINGKSAHRATFGIAR